MAGAHQLDQANMEVLIIRVENGGRTGVTVSSPTFDYHPWRLRAYRKLENLPGMPVRRSVSSSLLDRNDSCTDLTHRLDPFDEATFIMRAEPLLKATDGYRPCWVRASVRVAGQSRERRSPMKTALRLADGQTTIDGERPELATLVYRGLFAEDEHKAAMAAHHVMGARHKDPDAPWSDMVEEMMPWASEALMSFTAVDSMLVEFEHITEQESQDAHERRLTWVRDHRNGLTL